MEIPGGSNRWNQTWPKISFLLGVTLVVVQIVQELRGLPIEPTLLAAGLGLCGLPAFKPAAKP